MDVLNPFWRERLSSIPCVFLLGQAGLMNSCSSQNRSTPAEERHLTRALNGHFQGRRDVLFLNCLWSSDAEVRRSPLSNWNSLPPCRQLLAYPTTGFILLAYPTDLYYLHSILTCTTSLSYWLPALAALYGRSWRAF